MYLESLQPNYILPNRTEEIFFQVFLISFTKNKTVYLILERQNFSISYILPPRVRVSCGCWLPLFHSPLTPETCMGTALSHPKKYVHCSSSVRSYIRHTCIDIYTYIHLMYVANSTSVWVYASISIYPFSLFLSLCSRKQDSQAFAQLHSPKKPSLGFKFELILQIMLEKYFCDLRCSSASSKFSNVNSLRCTTTCRAATRVLRSSLTAI